MCRSCGAIVGAGQTQCAVCGAPTAGKSLADGNQAPPADKETVRFARAVLKAYGVTDRTVWVADSFEGLPEADAIRHPYDHQLDLHVMAALAVSLDEVKKNFERYNLLDGQVKFLKGWFRDSLPAAPIERLAVLRVDGDHYESTMDVLQNLYPKVTDGGYVIIDDYRFVKGCDLAVEDFRRQHAITEELHLIPGSGGAYWRRGR